MRGADSGAVDPGVARARLTAALDEAIAQVAVLTADLEGIFDASASVATDDEHDPEGVTIAFERAQVAALLTAARERVAEVERALERVDLGSYGACERCGSPIDPARLEVRPFARTCVACA
jgi:RNA polymerase-binding transcription factor DksA